MKQPVFAVRHGILVAAEAGQGKLDEVIQGVLSILWRYRKVKVIGNAKVIGKVPLNQINYFTGYGVWFYPEWCGVINRPVLWRISR